MKRKSIWVTKILWQHGLGKMNVCTKSNSTILWLLLIFQFEPRQWIKNYVPARLKPYKPHSSSSRQLSLNDWSTVAQLIYDYKIQCPKLGHLGWSSSVVQLWLAVPGKRVSAHLFIRALPSCRNMLLCSDQSEPPLARTRLLQHQTIFLIKWSKAIAQTF